VGGHASTASVAVALRSGVAWGVGAGLLLTAADLIFLPHLPKLLKLARETSLLANFSASFYGGINEELLTRLLGVSALTWLLQRVLPIGLAAWGAIAVMALIFALGHLPATRAVEGKITPLLLGRTIGLNTPLAVACGWFFWRFGIEVAIAAHLVADLVYHVGGTALLRANDRHGFLPGLPPTQR
jgi:hypothetical protein